MLWRKILIRILLGLVTLWAVSVIIFLATNILPGDAARAILGQRAQPEALAKLRAEMGLDRPLLIQYVSWLFDFMHFDMGVSLKTKQPVWEMLRPRLMNTLLLLVTTSFLAVPLSMLLGMIMAIRRGGLRDNILNSIMIVMAGIPEFVIAIVLILVLSTQVFHVLPPTALLPAGETTFQNLQILVLPTLTLVIAIIPYLSRLVRGSLVDALASEYVVTARLNGVTERRVLVRHAMRNSLVPVIQASALTLAFILGGAVVVEFVFQFPGLGVALQQAVASRDLFVIQAIILIFSAGYITFNLLADILSILVTPRLRT